MAVYMESKLGVNYISKLKLKINLQKRIYWIIFFQFTFRRGLSKEHKTTIILQFNFIQP